MNRPTDDRHPSNQEKPKRQGLWGGHRDEIYEFRDSNIKERHGYYPLWLTLVGVVLVLWSVWYAYKYWGPPH